MKKQFPWAKVFALQTTIFATAFTASIAIGGALLVSFLVWVSTDIWQWTPVNRWLRFVVLAAIGGVLTGALFTHYQWLVHTSSSLARKVATTALVVTIYITLLVVLREWIGEMLPG